MLLQILTQMQWCVSEAVSLVWVSAITQQQLNYIVKIKDGKRKCKKFKYSGKR